MSQVKQSGLTLDVIGINDSHIVPLSVFKEQQNLFISGRVSPYDKNICFPDIKKDDNMPWPPPKQQGETDIDYKNRYKQFYLLPRYVKEDDVNIYADLNHPKHQRYHVDSAIGFGGEFQCTIPISLLVDDETVYDEEGLSKLSITVVFNPAMLPSSSRVFEFWIRNDSVLYSPPLPIVPPVIVPPKPVWDGYVNISIDKVTGDDKLGPLELAGDVEITGTVSGLSAHEGMYQEIDIIIPLHLDVSLKEPEYIARSDTLKPIPGSTLHSFRVSIPGDKIHKSMKKKYSLTKGIFAQLTVKNSNKNYRIFIDNKICEIV